MRQIFFLIFLGEQEGPSEELKEACEFFQVSAAFSRYTVASPTIGLVLWYA